MRSSVIQGYVPELDGLRALAILVVMIFHAAPQVLPGGFLGVEVFFVLSGFLITSLLLSEHDRLGRIDFRNFYLRRVLRLFPALVVMVGLICLSGPFLLNADQSLRLLKDGGLVFTYAYNWLRAFEIRCDGYLGHSWSLAIEEQFYFLWPPLLAGGLVVCKSRAVLARNVFILAAIGIFWRLMLISQGAGLYRIYNGLDTRCDGILLGCAAAITLSSLRSNYAKSLSRYCGLLPACAALAAFMGVALTTNVFDQAAYLWGLPLTSCLTLLLLGHITHCDHSLLQRALSSRGLVWIGQRSYGLYLWHYPILRLSRDCGLSHTCTLFLGFVLTMVLAELCYRLVERPLVLRYRTRLVARSLPPVPSSVALFAGSGI